VNHQNNYLENLKIPPSSKNIRNQIEALQLKVEDEKAAISVLKEKEAFLVAKQGHPGKGNLIYTRPAEECYGSGNTNNMDQVTTTILKKNRLIREYEKPDSCTAETDS